MTTVERLFIGGPMHGKRDLIESIHATEAACYNVMELPQDVRTYHYHHALQSQGRAVYMLEGLEGAEALVDVLFDAIKINS